MTGNSIRLKYSLICIICNVVIFDQSLEAILYLRKRSRGQYNSDWPTAVSYHFMNVVSWFWLANSQWLIFIFVIRDHALTKSITVLSMIFSYQHITFNTPTHFIPIIPKWPPSFALLTNERVIHSV